MEAHVSSEDPKRSTQRSIRRLKPRRPEVTPEQLRVRRGSLPIGPALDALAELLVDAWFAREERRGT